MKQNGKNSQIRVIYSENIISLPIFNSADSYVFFLKIWDKELLNIQEQVYIVYLNSANEVIGWRLLNTGTCAESLFDIKFAVAIGLGCMACKVLVAHNHPSGAMPPSKKDLLVTHKLYQAFALIDIELLDHLIMYHRGYFSFKDHKVEIK